MLKKTGPGMLIAAAFIGPGTVTTCIRAGVEFNYALLWALLLSILATVILQEISGRLGLVTGQGLPSLLKNSVSRTWLKYALLGLILSAVIIGNTAYEAGNIAGGVLGLEALFGPRYKGLFAWLIGAFAFGLLWAGSYKLLEKVFAGLVALMSVSFLLTAVLVKPELSGIAKGMFIPRLDSDSLFTVMALIGTTVVPYNLFLYPALVRQRWSGASHMGEMRRDIAGSVLIGGLVSMAIMVTAAGSGLLQIEGILDMAAALEPIYGVAARYATGIGLLAAGITSAITAPLAAAYVAQQCFDWKEGNRFWKFRMVWLGVLLFGVVSLSMDFRPLEVIFFAQVANALLLPLIALMLWYMAASTRWLGTWRSRWFGRLLGLLVVLLVTALGVRSLLAIFMG